MKDILEDLIKEGSEFNYRNFAATRSKYTDEFNIHYPTSFLPEYLSWRIRSNSLICRLYPDKDHPTSSLFAKTLEEDKTLNNGQDKFNKSHQSYLGCLQSALSEYKQGIVGDSSDLTVQNQSPRHLVELICKQFHRVAVQLRRRYDERETIDINDEYDVQDLLHALFKIYFDDVRPEDYVPSESGGNSRIDFIIEGTGVGVEVKKTRKGLNDKKLGEELLIDISRYEAHPKCSHLVCFIYDPEERIVNPKGLENDLSNKSKTGFGITLIVSPQR